MNLTSVKIKSVTFFANFMISIDKKDIILAVRNTS